MTPRMLSLEEYSDRIEALFVLPRTGGLVEIVVPLNTQWVCMALFEAGMVRSTSEATRLIKKGRVTVDGEAANVDLRLPVGRVCVFGLNDALVYHRIDPRIYSSGGPEWIGS